MRAAILSALVDHPKAVITVLLVALTVLAGIGIYRAGENAQSAKDQAAAKVAERRADSAMAWDFRQLATVKAQNDSLRTRADSLPVVVAKKRTAASLVNSRLVLHGDTAKVSTDTGVVAIPIPDVLTRQLAAMRLVNDSLVIAMDRQHEADTALIRGLTQQVAVDSAVQTEYRKQLASVEAELAADEAKPKHSGVVAFLVGVGTALAGVVILVVVH